MATLYKDISGTSISQVEQTIASDSILSRDLFLVSQQALTSTNPSRTYQWHDKTLNNFYASRKLSYNALSTQAFNDLCSDFGIKSMAWESSADYSLHDHVHPYSKVLVESFVDLSVFQDQSLSEHLVATVKDGSKSTQLYVPPVKYYGQPKPYIGQLKFLATQTIEEVDCNSPSFDGWVYPDGREVSQSKFSEAYRFFGNDYGPASPGMFRIPCLSSFIKIFQLMQTTDKETTLSAQVPAHEVLKRHQHSISNLKVNASISATVSYTNVSNFTNGYACHGKKGVLSESQKYDFYVKARNIGIIGGQGTSEASSDRLTHPTYDLLPVLMYIGVN